MTLYFLRVRRAREEGLEKEQKETVPGGKQEMVRPLEHRVIVLVTYCLKQPHSQI